MTRLLLLSCFSLLTVSATSYASAQDTPESLLASSSCAPHAHAALKTPTPQEWRLNFFASESLSEADITTGFKIFNRTYNSVEWMQSLKEYYQDTSKSVESRALVLSNFASHMSKIREHYASESWGQFLPLFPTEDALYQAATATFGVLETFQSTFGYHNIYDRGILETKQILVDGYFSLCAYFGLLANLGNRAYDLRDEHAERLASLALAPHKSILADDYADLNNWSHVFLEDILAQKRALDEDTQCTLHGSVLFAYAISRQEEKDRGNKRDQADQQTLRRFLTQVQSVINEDHTERKHAHWSFPYAATLYTLLDQAEDALHIWHEFAKIHPVEKWDYRTLTLAIRQLANASKDTELMAQCWQQYQKVANINLEEFKPTLYDLKTILFVTGNFSRLDRPQEALHIIRAVEHFYAQDYASFKNPGYKGDLDRAQTFFSLIKARSLVYVDQYEEAAKLYGRYFQVTPSAITTRMAASAYPDIHHDAQSAVIAFYKSGQLKIVPAKASRASSAQKKSAKPTRARSQARSQTGPQNSMALAAQAHLVSHYDKVLKDTQKRVNALLSFVAQPGCDQNLRDKINEIQNHLVHIKDSLHPQTPPVQKNAKRVGTPAAALAPTPFVKLGEVLDHLRDRIKDLEAPLQDAIRAHKAQQKQALMAYFADLEQDAQSLTPLALTTKRAATPTPASKVKTRGQPAASSSQAPLEQKSASAMQGSAPAKVLLFLTERAQADLARLSPELQTKFYAFSEEIAQNPMQITGAQGRPERLTFAQGHYMSRRLTKGDRIVYQIIAEGEGKYRVIFSSLRGHYKRLAQNSDITRISALETNAPLAPASSSSQAHQ
ncbi:MAG: hypothetical protein LCH26_03990 [Proteobacteria bacterium]|nr:hypothetical protein [Pseudomonadota bacterium]